MAETSQVSEEDTYHSNDWSSRLVHSKWYWCMLNTEESTYQLEYLVSVWKTRQWKSNETGLRYSPGCGKLFTNLPWAEMKRNEVYLVEATFSSLHCMELKVVSVYGRIYRLAVVYRYFWNQEMRTILGKACHIGFFYFRVSVTATSSFFLQTPLSPQILPFYFQVPIKRPSFLLFAVFSKRIPVQVLSCWEVLIRVGMWTNNHTKNGKLSFPFPARKMKRLCTFHSQIWTKKS